MNGWMEAGEGGRGREDEGGRKGGRYCDMRNKGATEEKSIWIGTYALDTKYYQNQSNKSVGHYNYTTRYLSLGIDIVFENPCF